MAYADIDFEGTGNEGASAQPANNATTDGNPAASQEDVTSLSSPDVVDINQKDEPAPEVNNEKGEKGESEKEDNNSSTGVLNPGDSVEVDGTTYTVNNKGDLVDDKGNVFKESKDVAEWLKSVEVEDNNEEKALDIKSIQEALGTTITDENGKPIEFTNDAEGVKSYVDSVIELRSNELQQAAVNRLYQDNPLLKQFQDYVQLTGSPKGFGELPDRSGIQLNKDNEAQLVAVIKMAAQEFGNKSLNDNYIKYLRDSGSLYDEAKNQLEALVAKDTQVRKDIETRAAQQRAEAEAENKAYWETVEKTISNRKIGDYKLPESITKEVNGQKLVFTTKDFYDFVSVPKERKDGQLLTDYQVALNNLTEEQYLNRELLDAWLRFTGGTYKDLVDMAVKEEQVRQLRVRSKEQRANKAVKVIRKSSGKVDMNDIIL